MWPYFLVLFLIIALQFKFNKHSNHKLNYIIAFIILFYFAALRGNGYGDYFTYLEYSTLITSIEKVLDSSFPMEIGFRIISYIVNRTNIHQQFVIIIMNLISLTCIYKFIEKYSPDKMLSVLFFLPLYFQYDMQAARTAVAIGISTLSFKYLYEKKLLKYLILVILASCFHKTAIILIPMYFLAHIRMNKYFGIVSILVTIILTSLMSFSTIVVNIIKFLGMNSYAYKFHRYIQSTEYGYQYKLYDPRLLLVIGIYILASG